MSSPHVALTEMPSKQVVSIRSCFDRMASSVLGRMRSLIVLQFFLKIASVLLFSSAFGAFLGWLLSFDGSPAIGNTAMIGFAISPVGLASALLIPTAFLAIVYLEQACILCVYADPTGQVIRPILRAVAKLPQIMQLAAIQTAMMLGITVPFLLIAACTYWTLLSDADINFYLTYWPPKFWLAVGMGIVLAVFASILQLLIVFRWFLSLPWLLIGNLSPIESLRRSAQERIARPTVWRSMLVWLFVRIACSIVGLLSIGCLTYIAVNLMGHHRSTSLVVTTSLLLMHSVIASGLSSIDQCWHVAGKWQAYRWIGAHSDEFSENEAKAAVSRRRATVFGLIVVFTVLVLGFVSFQQALSLSDQHDVQVVAHRAGAIRAPENSLSALRLAIEEGADAAEIDVQLSRDGTIFVIHDRDLMRLASTPLEVAKATDVELRAVPIGLKHRPAFPDERLATLDEFLEQARSKIRLSIELKYYGWNESLAVKVVELLRSKEMLDQCEIISLEYRALEQVRALEPKIARGYLVSTSLGDITKLNAQLLSVSQSEFTAELRRKASSRKIKVAVWTIDSPETMFQLMVKGADQIVTNDPVAAVAVAQEYADLNDVELFLVRLRERLSR